MTKTLDKKESVNVETVKVEAPPVTPQATVSQKAVETPAMPPVRQRKSFGLLENIKLFLRIVIVMIAAGVLVTLGYYIGTKLVPEVNKWLINHNFIEAPKDSQTVNPPQMTTTETTPVTASSIPDIVQKVNAGVVSIAIASATINQANGVVQSSDKIGTGFVIDSEAGIILTNQHVVSDTIAQYQVITSDEKVLTPTKIVRDQFNDIALIFVSAKNLKAIPMGDSSKIRVGETVIAIGTPLGEYPGSVTVGVVSGLGRNVTTGSSSFWGQTKEYENVIQTDAAVNPGNSGGPLINSNAQVIGVNFATTSGAENISFALPINLVKQRLAEFKQYGRFRNPYLGVSYTIISDQQALLYGVKPGVFVRSVLVNSPASMAGIKPGDIITKIGDQKVNSSGITNILQKLKIGDEVEITIWRQNDTDKKGKELVLKAKIGEAPDNSTN